MILALGSGHFAWTEPCWPWLFLGMFVGYVLHTIIRIWEK